MKAKILGLTFALASAMTTQGALITFDFTGADPGQNNPWNTGTTIDTHADTDGFDLGGGVTGNIGDNRFNARSWSQGSTLASALSGDDYFGFTLTVDSGYVADLNSAVVTYTLQASGSGPGGYALFSSVDGFSDGAQLVSGSVSGTAALSHTFDSSGYNNLSDDIEFRIYGWEGTSSAGTMSANAFSLDGTITAVPEPAEWGMISALGLFAVAGLHSWRSRRKTSVASS